MNKREMDNLNLQNAFPEMPQDCRDALLRAARSVKEEKNVKYVRFTFKTALIAALLILSMTAVALAASGALGWSDFLGVHFGEHVVPSTAVNAMNLEEKKSYEVGPLTFTVTQLMCDGHIAVSTTDIRTTDGSAAILTSEPWDPIGAFGENIVAAGIRFKDLPVGTRLQAGEVYFEITQIGKECHKDCAIRAQTGDCIMPREGVFGRVLHGGEVRTGDELRILQPGERLPLEAAVITASDKGSSGQRVDESGAAVAEILTANGYTVVEKVILPDEQEQLAAKMTELAERGVALIATTGGTGFSPRDITPEATLAVCERLAPGIPEALRALSL